ncbi:DapH/DapD/GlmU-related protein [Flavisolibacter tropicus]|uniref:Acetyltransferase n=1 Tax=Flavisolibacter tropicus TaxID=1492898 RepID=A0A172TQB3_9BACT|nr:DapH/DapD/GlmU-related protein [Flavisolibacter tropicus]ANE49251.1 acetyltransferase [Flavisolibacter tropicus]
MNKKKLVIFPFNGNGIEALDCIDFDEYELIGFIDDNPFKKVSCYPLFSRDILLKYGELYVLAVPGNSLTFRDRKEVILSLNVDRFVTIIHPRSSIGRNVSIGHNCLIMAGVVLTSNVKLGNHVCVLPNSVLHHDVSIGNYTLIGSNVVIAGGTAIGESCYVGSGTNIINGVSIGDSTLIGLGSNITKTVVEGSKMVGNPARNLNISSVQ